MKNTKKEETFTVDGSQLLNKVKELITEGNARKITIKNKEGKVVALFPLTHGVVGAAFAPILAGLGVIVTLIGECTISVEKE